MNVCVCLLIKLSSSRISPLLVSQGCHSCRAYKTPRVWCVSEQVAIVIKYFFQFGFFPWNKYVDYTKDKPYHPPNIIGIEKKEGYVHYDLVQLLALFFHRSILKVI